MRSQSRFSDGVPSKILSRGEQALHQERGLHKIAGIIEHVEHRQTLSGVSIHEVRPRAMIARRFFQERDNFPQPLESLVHA